MPEPKHRFTVTLEAIPGSVDPIARLKRLLKYALRVCDLRCVDLSESPPPEREKHSA